jgi:hypothetical protein
MVVALAALAPRAAVVVTLGADGVAYAEAQGAVHHAAARAVKVRSTHGAGDMLGALAGRLAAALLRGDDLWCSDCLRAGSRRGPDRLRTAPRAGRTASRCRRRWPPFRPPSARSAPPRRRASRHSSRQPADRPVRAPHDAVRPEASKHVVGIGLQISTLQPSPRSRAPRTCKGAGVPGDPRHAVRPEPEALVGISRGSAVSCNGPRPTRISG